jgi:hypothetical protein
MTPDDTGDTVSERVRRYDRAHLLSAEKRNQVLALWQVQQYGLDSYGDPDYVYLYGMRPAEWYGQGIRLLARTTVECTRDLLADAIGQDVARLLQHAPDVGGYTVIDPFAGSCNTLYWILRHVPSARGLACELDPTIYAMARTNLAALDSLDTVARSIDLLYGDYRTLLSDCRVPSDHLVVVFVAPPWGDALDAVTGLDLRRTQPPVGEVMDAIDSLHQDKPVLYVTQVHQHLEPTSRMQLESRYTWSELRIYDELNVEGMQHGILLGSRRWTPSTR